MGPVVRDEHPLTSDRARGLLIASLLGLATATAFLMVGLDATRSWVQAVDDRFLNLVVRNRSGPVTATARVLDVLGGFAVLTPVRLLVGAYLAFRRRWWHLSAFVAAVVASEAFIGGLKDAYDRPRPPAGLALVDSTGSAFPSGHAVAVAASVTAMVLVLVPVGPSRWWWGSVAVMFSFVMAASRAYLAVHWLSDAVAGALLGFTLAVVPAVAVQWVRDGRARRRAPPDEHPLSRVR